MERWIIVVLLGIGALLVRCGLAMYGVGLSRSKNAASAGMRQLCDFFVSILAFVAVGQMILFYQTPAGAAFNLNVLFHAPRDNVDSIFFHAILFSIASSVMTGAAGERSRFFAMLAAPAMLCGSLIPLAGQWAWHGWLSRMQFIDVAGASVVHVAAAACALVVAVLVGPRTGKYNHDGSANGIPGHNLPLACAGLFVTLAMWVALVMGATALHGAAPSPQVAINVLLASCAGGMVSLIYGRLRYGKVEFLLTLGGALGGAVSISAAAAVSGSIGAVLIGAIAGVLVPLASIALDLALHVDDPVGGIAIHGVGGAWGTLAAALFVHGSVAVKFKALGVQAMGVLAIATTVAIATLALLVILRSTIGIRSSESDEFDGLDLAEHDINAYPDFQQTMIKSYHLRET